MNKISKTKNGFTLIETLVAITILMISIVGPLTIAQKSLKAALQAKDQVFATYLAQSIMEDIKRSRSIYVVNNWSESGLYGFELWKKKFETDHFGCGPFKRICPATIYIKSEGYDLYNNSGVTKSKFSWKTEIADYSLGPISSPDVLITVTVSWKNGTILNETKVENLLFDVIL